MTDMAHDWDDEDFERLLDALRRCAEAAQQRAIEGMEQSLADAPATIYGDVPPPGYCHPALAQHRGFILDWLDGLTFGGYFLQLPVPVPNFAFKAVTESPAPQMSRVLTMRKQRAWAPAPYVGRPYVYWWWTGVDDHGRGAGSANTHRAYTDGGPQ